MNIPAALDAPYSPESEEAVLGALLINPACFMDVDTEVDASDFFLLRHARIYSCISSLCIRETAVDFLTVSEELKAAGWYEDAGGASYLMQLMNNTPTSVHAAIYAGMVKRLATRRKYLEVSDKMRSIAKDETLDIEHVTGSIESAVLDIGARHIKHNGVWLDEGIDEVWQDMMHRYEHEDSDTIVRTGYPDVDMLISGLEQERFYVLAGRPGMGKTAWAINEMMSLVKRKIPVIYHTMEMSKAQIIRRILALESGISTHRQQKPRSLNPDDLRKLEIARHNLRGMPLYIEDMPSPTPRQVRAKSEWLIRRHGFRVVLIDGIYRMSADYDTKGDDTRAYSQIAMALKNMARSLKVPVLATHQLNRELEKRGDKRPVLSDLRQSGRIEEEADAVLFLYRECLYDKTADERHAELICAKNRDGDVGIVSLDFDKSITKFSSVSRANTYP